ncbi:MAG: hypothetical protein L0241_24025 [Planctomycetia bacterium]|nr:hypothetical protein [Planctomycetia bacterium]
MEAKRVAVVVSHPAHLLTVAGMLLRWRPHILMVNRAVAGGGVNQEDVIRSVFEPLRLDERITSFGISESESFKRTLAGDFAFHASTGVQIFDWLLSVRPHIVLGDAYEAYNFHHDLTRMLLDGAINCYRSFRGEIENYEFPLSCRVNQPGAEVQYGVFPFGEFHELHLNARETVLKRRLIAEAGRIDSFVAGVAPLFPATSVETYREVPADRDYTLPPAGLALYYDERGREVVEAGLYPKAITFRKHFVPLVRALETPARETVAA